MKLKKLWADPHPLCEVDIAITHDGGFAISTTN
jgi:hypothetical protein